MSAPLDGLAAVGAAALAASTDRDPRVRALAGRFLVAGLGDPQVDQALERLVDDPADTAVTREVACALVADGGSAGLRLMVGCLAGMDHTDTAAHWVLEGMNDAWHEEPGAGEDALSRLVEDPDARVAAGARWALGQREQLRDTPVPERRRRRWW